MVQTEHLPAQPVNQHGHHVYPMDRTVFRSDKTVLLPARAVYPLSRREDLPAETVLLWDRMVMLRVRRYMLPVGTVFPPVHPVPL